MTNEENSFLKLNQFKYELTYYKHIEKYISKFLNAKKEDKDGR